MFDPDVARSIVGTFASCILGGAIWRKSSYLLGRVDSEVASELVTIIDDPLLPGTPGARPFDGEGVASRRTTIVDGIDNAVDAFLGMMRGENTGKMLVRI